MNRFVLVAGLLSIATTASAQDVGDANGLEQGNWSVAVGVAGTGSGTLGAWYMVSDGINLGLNLGLAFASSDTEGAEETQFSDVVIEPAVKGYLWTDRSVAPFAYASVFFGTRRLDQTISVPGIPGSDFTREITDEENRYGAGLGFGAEWFPIENVSIGGHAGVRFGWSEAESVSDSGASVTRDGFFFHTFTSELTLFIYF